MNSITVTVKTLISDAEVQLDNDAGLQQTGTARVNNQIVGTGYSGPTTVDNSFSPQIVATDLQISASQNFVLAPNDGDAVGTFDIGGEDYAIWQPGTLEGVGTASVASTDVAFFAWQSQYVGEGTISFSIESLYSTTATFVGNDGEFTGNTPSGQFFAEVTYDYTPAVVPESSTFVVILGLTALAFVATRRRR